MIKLKVIPQFPSSVEAGPGVTITKSNGIWTIGFDFSGSVGSAVQAWDPDLDALSAFSGVGFAVRSDAASSTWVQRSIIGTANEITLTNGNGVSGNPVVSLPSALTYTGKTVTGGTFLTPIIATIINTGTLTLPTSTDTLVGRATTDTLTNKTFDTAGAGNSLLINGVAATANTGTGAVVRATSPTLVTPALGTPSAITLTNGTGLPVSTGVSGLGTGISTFLSTPTSANLRGALTDETGTGAAVFANSPAIVTPTGIVKGDVGLGNVDNTSDANKPVSTAQAAADALAVPRAGGTMTGFLTLSADPTSALHASTKQYVDGLTGASSWTSYSPTISSATGAPTSATATGRYKAIGKTVFVQMDITIITVGAASGQLRATLPFNATSNRYSGSVFEYFSTAKSGACFVDGAGNPSYIATRDATGSAWWVAGYQLSVGMVYEIP